MSKYFVFHYDEDGIGCGVYNNKIELEKWLAECLADEQELEFWTMPESDGWNTFDYYEKWPEGSYLIIEGMVKTPKPIEIVKRLEI